MAAEQYTHLASADSGAEASYVSFTNISQDYQELELYIQGQAGRLGTTGWGMVGFRCATDAAGTSFTTTSASTLITWNYNYSSWASWVRKRYSTTTTESFQVPYTEQSPSGAAYPDPQGAYRIRFQGYSNAYTLTTYTMTGISADYNGTSGSGTTLQFNQGGIGTGQAAITGLRIAVDSSSVWQYSQFSLYGITGK